MNQILAIAQNTYREAVRNRIFFVLALFAMVLLFVSLALSSGSMHQEVRLMKDSGLFLTSTSCVLIAIFVGVNLVYKELERKTVYTIMPKPIDRSQFLLGKYLGLAFVMLILVVVMGLLLAAHLMRGHPKNLAIPPDRHESTAVSFPQAGDDLQRAIAVDVADRDRSGRLYSTPVTESELVEAYAP